MATDFKSATGSAVVVAPGDAGKCPITGKPAAGAFPKSQPGTGLLAWIGVRAFTFTPGTRVAVTDTANSLSKSEPNSS